MIPPTGKLGVLLPGMGAVSTTAIAGVELLKRGLGRPVGSLTQYGSIETNGKSRRIREMVPLAQPDDLVFGGWDVFPENCYAAARNASVLHRRTLNRVREPLEALQPWKAVFDPIYVPRLSGPNVKTGKSKEHLARQLMDDIDGFRERNKLHRLVMVWCASTETYIEPQPVHQSLREFERGLRTSDPAISPSMIYAYAAISRGVPYCNGAPNFSADIPALVDLSHRNAVPVCGKDFKTGQTMMKTILAPALKARQLGLRGWFSTNILGNRDGEVLDEPASCQTKKISKLSVLDSILEPESHRELYGQFDHQVHINYYKARGDDKEAWDNIDIFGWMDYPMQIKINFLCRDSILAAPLVLDLSLLLDLAHRGELSGVQDWLSSRARWLKTVRPARTISSASSSCWSERCWRSPVE